MVVIPACLQLVMKAPVWFLIGRVGVVGGSDGYHRAYLIDRCIYNFWNWWLLGTKSTNAWASADNHLFDVTNQYVATAADGGLLALTNWVGVGNLRRYKVRFAKQTWPGETFNTQIKVVGKRKENGDNLVDLECTLVNQDGEVKVAGEAVAALPARG